MTFQPSSQQSYTVTINPPDSTHFKPTLSIEDIMGTWYDACSFRFLLSYTPHIYQVCYALDVTPMEGALYDQCHNYFGTNARVEQKRRDDLIYTPSSRP